MNINKKIVIIGIVVLLAAIVGLGIILFQKSEPEPILIGAILPLTGGGDVAADLAQKGMFLAAEEINTQGGVNGRPLELVFADSKTDAEEAKKVFIEMEEEIKPLLYFNAFSDIGLAVGPLAEQKEVVMLVLFATSDKVVEGKEWVFKYPKSSPEEAEPILFILKKLGTKSLGFIYLNDEYGRDLSKTIGTAFEKTGGVVRKIAYKPNEFDFREYIGALQDTDAIYFIGFAPHKKEFFTQVKKINYQGYLMGDSTFSRVSTTPEAEGVYIAAWGFYNPNFIFAREVSARYQTVYGEEMGFQSATGYDSVRIIADLLEGEELSRGNLQYVLDRGFTYSGVLGEVNLLPGERSLVPPLFPARIINGTLEYLQ